LRQICVSRRRFGIEPVRICQFCRSRRAGETTDRIVRYGPIGIPDPPDFGVGPSARVSLIVLRVDGHWVLIGEGLGPENTDHDFDKVLRGLQPIVDSITWS